MKRLLNVIVVLASVWGVSAQAELRAFACEPEWAALLQELGGNQLVVFSATTARQDPHAIQARPALIAQLRRADLLVCSGAGLEEAWLPVLLRRANNPAVQAGRPGHFEAAAFVELLDQPARLDRALGDVHAAGNPHFHTNPHNITQVARALGKRLAQLDEANAAAYRRRLADFEGRWQAAIADWERRGAALKGMRVVTQHKGWSDLIQWLGLDEAAVLEPKPGIPPGAAHLAAVLKQLQAQPAAAVINAAYQSGRSARWLSDKTDMPVVTLPYTVGADEHSGDLFALFDTTLRRLLAVAP
ncbi:zinc ABC transporter substrate-binding protein [Candidatus Tenderia electrophaga]|jgi:zinc/manganese transport system substrate-binding protein|uniref:Zinc ABC transporter substrate-binding protein n=1 Tax=Candidatus Tenderia electrophaga TaxID=1748243 RepID=A0A0S2TBP8_9GAMM|nr:zinc ABC transporter substrate-binding protein [Candidatus Tenderia electrophaga]